MPGFGVNFREGLGGSCGEDMIKITLSGYSF